MMSVESVKLDDNGTITVVPIAELKARMKSESRIVEATVSVRESRQRGSYQAHERFLSARIDFTLPWLLVDQAKQAGEDHYKAARATIGDMMVQKIQETEAVLYNNVCEIQAKDNVTVFPRKPG